MLIFDPQTKDQFFDKYLQIYVGQEYLIGGKLPGFFNPFRDPKVKDENINQIKNTNVV